MLPASWLAVLAAVAATPGLATASTPVAPITPATPAPSTFIVGGTASPLFTRDTAALSRLGRLADERTLAAPVTVTPGVAAFDAAAANAIVTVGGSESWVRTVAITLAPTASRSIIQVYSESGILLESRSAAPGSTITLSYPGSVHRVVVREIPDLAAALSEPFEDPPEVLPIPAPAPLAALGAAAIATAGPRRRPRR